MPAIHNKKLSLFVIILGVVAIGGVLVATRIELGGKSSTNESGASKLIISEIILGTPSSSEELKKINPKLTQKTTFKTNEPIAMRISARQSSGDPISINVHLVEENGSIIPLNPATAMFTPPVSSFCCWKITMEGTYSLQIFGPQGLISTIPITVEKSQEETATSAGLAY